MIVILKKKHFHTSSPSCPTYIQCLKETYLNYSVRTHKLFDYTAWHNVYHGNGVLIVVSAFYNSYSLVSGFTAFTVHGFVEAFA